MENRGALQFGCMWRKENSRTETYYVMNVQTLCLTMQSLGVLRLLALSREHNKLKQNSNDTRLGKVLDAWQ